MRFVIGEALLQPQKKKKNGRFMGGDFSKMFGIKGRGVVQARLDNCVTIFENATTWAHK
jgi:preprotein translocase subunit SecG